MRIVPTVIGAWVLVCCDAPLFHGSIAEAAESNRACGVEPPATLARMRDLTRERKWRELVEQLQDVDYSAWPAESADQAAEALHLRGQAYSTLKQGRAAEADLKAAVKLAPRRELAWLSLADNYANNLQDDRQALDAYRQVLAITGRGNGWLPISATLATARILTDQVRTEEALETLKPYDGADGVAPIWRIRLLRAYGHVYAAQGKEQESLARFREALELESRQ
jgi:tetratricopeptide (TPR) repeat protein